ncbi:MAG: DUF4389 domain-containing protein [Candidatus Levyibacteriota bacterium]
MEKTSTAHKASTHSSPSRMYPKLVIKNNENPNALYAFPFAGFLIKMVMLIPAFVFLFLIWFVFAFLWLLTPFVIIFTGKYWESAEVFTKDYMIYKTKITLFLIGLTDKYPGFNLETDGIFELHLEKPAEPNLWLTFPLLGFAIRTLLLIPYNIYKSVLSFGMWAAVFASWFAVLFTGKYPESLYEFERDTIRVSLAYTLYIAYFSNTYPSFWISMKHKTTKVILLILGALLFLIANRYDNHHQPRRMHPMPMNNPPSLSPQRSQQGS